MEEYDTAHSDYDTAISLSPENPKFYHSKGLAHQETGDHAEAIDMYLTALDKDPKHIASRYHLGLMY